MGICTTVGVISYGDGNRWIGADVHIVLHAAMQVERLRAADWALGYVGWKYFGICHGDVEGSQNTYMDG